MTDMAYAADLHARLNDLRRSLEEAALAVQRTAGEIEPALRYFVATHDTRNAGEYRADLRELLSALDAHREASRALLAAAAPDVPYPRLWLDVAKDRGAQFDPDGSISGAALAEVGIAILNGCPRCQATVAPYNSYQVAPDDPYAYCADCADVAE